MESNRFTRTMDPNHSMKNSRTIPNEVLLMVVEEVHKQYDRTTLNSLGLVNSTLRAFVRPYLFQNLYLSKSLVYTDDFIENLSARPYILPNVRYLTISSWIALPDKYRTMMRDGISETSWKYFGVDERICKEASEQVLERLAKVFSVCRQNIETIRFQGRLQYLPNLEQTMFEQLITRVFYNNIATPILYQFDFPKLKEISMTWNSKKRLRGSSYLMNIYNILVKNNPNHPIHRHMFSNNAQQQPNPYLADLQKNMGRLEKLTMIDEEDSAIAVDDTCAIDIISDPTMKLKELKLQLNSSGYSTLEAIASQTQLTNLELTDIESFNGVEFSTALERIQGLQRLTLKSVNMAEKSTPGPSTWTRVFDFMIQLPKLSKVHFEKLSYSAGYRQARAQPCDGPLQLRGHIELVERGEEPAPLIIPGRGSDLTGANDPDYPPVKHAICSKRADDKKAFKRLYDHFAALSEDGLDLRSWVFCDHKLVKAIKRKK